MKLSMVCIVCLSVVLAACEAPFTLTTPGGAPPPDPAPGPEPEPPPDPGPSPEPPPDPGPDPAPEPQPDPGPDPAPEPPPDPGPSPEPQPDPHPFFDPREIPVEMQAWWIPAFGHIHAAAKLPLGQRVSGMLEFDVRIVLHNNPSHLRELRIDTDESVFERIPLDHDCAYDGTTPTTCVFSVPVSIDTRRMSDGWRELRIRATTLTPDNKDYLNSSGIQVFVDNGNPRSDYQRASDNQGLIGRGWYEGFDYTNAWIGNVPKTVVRGSYTFQVRAQKPSARLQVALDKTHFIAAVGSWPQQDASPGTILFDREGDFGSFLPVTVDTRQLANGWHTLAVTSFGPNGEVSQCAYCDDSINKPAGVAKIWFYVEN